MAMDETTVLREATKYLWTVVAGVGAWLFNKQESRIKALEDSNYSKTAAKERRDEVDKALEDRRQDVIALHFKIDARAEKLDDKIDELTKDINRNFSDLKDMLFRRIEK